MALKPHTVDHSHAAALPLAALTAWQALFDHANLSAGQKILIHGAAGGVGNFAVQFARWRGAYVIETARRAEAKLLYEIGADQVIDYVEEEFEEQVQNVDVVFDTVGGEALEKSWQVVTPNGVLVTIADPKDKNPSEKSTEYDVRGIYFIVEPNRYQLMEIARLVDEGQVRSLIDSTFPLSEGRKAFEQALLGYNRGKTVLQILSKGSCGSPVADVLTMVNKLSKS